MPHIPVAAVEEIIGAGQRMDQRGWVPATAGNISVQFEPGRIAITRSGLHKGFMDGFCALEVDLDGRPVQPNERPSAETLLHCQIYREFAGTGAVLHGHSVPATVLSLSTRADGLTLAGYELFKAFAGQTTHAAELWLPIFDNDQDIPALAGRIAPHLANAPLGYVIRGHGVYVWGADMERAMAHLEALEFILACELERRRG